MARVFIKSFGCSLNMADGEAMAGVLQQSGHVVMDDEYSADVVVINSCIVKGHSQAQLFTYLDKMEAMGKRVVIAGCGAQAFPDRLSKYPIIGTRQVAKINEAVLAALEGKTPHSIEKVKTPRLSLPKRRKNQVIDIVPINNGCLGSCSFCIVKRTRGNLESYDPEDIVYTIEQAVKDGVKEVWLTSPDTACYGVDINQDIPSLLKRVCAIPGDFKIRLGMGNPDWFIKYLDELPKIFASGKMFRFLHVPVQSGSEAVLKSMRRNYSPDDYVRIVDTMRAADPLFTISTDVIAGFPGETDEDFQKTVKILGRTTPDVLNLSRFTPRPGTSAESLPGQLKGDVKKARSTVIDELHERISHERNKLFIGWTGKIIIDEQGKHGTMIGRNLSYKPVAVDGFYPLGSVLGVEITEAHERFLKGKVLQSL